MIGLEERKKQLLRYLVHTNGYVTTEKLAKELNVSEKTIRNDLKRLDVWLQSFLGAGIIRQPGMGVELRVSDEEREAILHHLDHAHETGPDTTLMDPFHRKIILLRILLEEERVFTLQQLSDRLYVSKATVSQDLTLVEQWLDRYGLRLIRKPNMGLRVEGDERSRRLAMAKFSQMPSKGSLGNNRLEPSHQDALIKQTIRKIERKSDLRFTDEAVERLTVHVAIALKRVKMGCRICLSSGEMARLQVKREYRLAEELAKDLEKTFAVTLPKDEIAYMAMHLLGAKWHYVPVHVDQLTHSLDRVDEESIQLSQKLIAKMEELTGLPLTRDRELLVGLSIHMQTAVHRIRHRLYVTNPILHDIKRSYRYMFETVLLAVSMMEFDMEGKVSEDEAGYLTMHFQAAWERLKKHHVHPKKVLLVCTTGVGTSQLMAARISRWFPSLTILGTTPVSRLKQSLELVRPDLLISTVPLTESSIPMVHVSPLLSERDRKNIQRAVMEEVSSTGSNRSGATVTLKTFIDPRMVWLDVDGEDRDQVIRLMAERLIEAGFAKEGFAESAWDREQISSTYIGGGVATPHGAVDLVIQSTVAVARLNKPMDWQGNPVFLVIMPCVNWQDKETAERVFADLVELSENPVRLHALRKADCVEQFLNEL